MRDIATCAYVFSLFSDDFIEISETQEVVGDDTQSMLDFIEH